MNADPFGGTTEIEMRGQAIHPPKYSAPAAMLAVITLLVPAVSSAQSRWRSATLQAGLAGGSTSFVGLGLSVTGEVGVYRHLRVFAQWTDWQALGGCSVDDAPSECNARAGLWELGLRQGLGVSPRVAPYVGAGVGLYRRRAPGSDGDLTHSPYVSIAAGIDVRVKPPVTVRVAGVHQEVLDDRIDASYRTGVRFTGVLFGVGLSVW